MSRSASLGTRVDGVDMLLVVRGYRLLGWQVWVNLVHYVLCTVLGGPVTAGAKGLSELHSTNEREEQGASDQSVSAYGAVCSLSIHLERRKLHSSLRINPSSFQLVLWHYSERPRGP